MYAHFIYSLLELVAFLLSDQVGDLGYASELGNYAEYSGAPNEEEVLQYARVVLDVRTIHYFSLIASWYCISSAFADLFQIYIHNQFFKDPRAVF